MVSQRLTMWQTREVLRQKWLLGRICQRQIALSLVVILGIVGMTVLRARAAGLGGPTSRPSPEIELEARLHGPPRPSQAIRPLPDGAWIHTNSENAGSPWNYSTWNFSSSNSGAAPAYSGYRRQLRPNSTHRNKPLSRAHGCCKRS
jgi:hypothetical protein